MVYHLQCWEQHIPFNHMTFLSDVAAYHATVITLHLQLCYHLRYKGSNKQSFSSFCAIVLQSADFTK